MDDGMLVIAEALASAWLNGEPDGMLFRELMRRIEDAR